MFNLVVLTGRLTADPELKTSKSGLSVTSFSIAVDRPYRKDKETETDFINIVAWREKAEFICRNFTRGSLIGIEGAIQTRRYQDGNGNNRTAFEVVVNNVQFVLPKSSTGASSSNNNDTPAQQNFSQSGSEDFADLGDSDDDLPF